MLATIWAYVCARAGERITWAGSAAAITGTVAMMSSYFTKPELRALAWGALVCGILACVVPTPNKDKPDAGS